MMLILHASWAEGQLQLWGEVPREGKTRSGPRRGRRSMTAATLPFGATESELRAALEQAGITLESTAGRAAAWVLRLPTVDGVPVASSPLIADPPAADGPATLAPWAITPLPVAGGALIGLLCASAGQ